ncbi:MAG: CopG family transcriptional regulator [Candidatus Firestonebacteria bacterium]|nr:CopG family transcriptional regulator [Candidatus Firestonebacteria bacterium]
MKRNKIDSDKPIGRLIRVKDFLPPPEKLVIPEDTIKVTLILKKSSIDFFKRKAAQHNTKYQKMIRELVDRYAMEYL